MEYVIISEYATFSSRQSLVATIRRHQPRQAITLPSAFHAAGFSFAGWSFSLIIIIRLFTYWSLSTTTVHTFAISLLPPLPLQSIRRWVTFSAANAPISFHWSGHSSSLIVITPGHWSPSLVRLISSIRHSLRHILVNRSLRYQ